MIYWADAVPSCKISDNIYYVGTKSGPSHLLVTDDGLVLIDTAYPKTLYILLENIRSHRFDPHDIKHIVHTHGHLDHFGGTRALVEMTGAKTYIGKYDADKVRAEGASAALANLPGGLEEPFEPDVLIEDGDVISFGSTDIKFLLTPGHTEGTLSLYFNTTYKGKTYFAGMFGGAGLNTLETEYMERKNVPICMRQKFLDSIDKIIDIPVELHLGNHISNNKYLDKQSRLTDEYNPFVEENTYVSFLKKLRATALEKFK